MTTTRSFPTLTRGGRTVRLTLWEEFQEIPVGGTVTHRKTRQGFRTSDGLVAYAHSDFLNTWVVPEAKTLDDYLIGLYEMVGDPSA